MRLFDLKMTVYDILSYSCIFICSYLWSFGGKMHIWCHHKQYFALLSYKANWFHVAMGLFSNNKSQKTSKCVRTLVTHSAVPCVLFFFFSDRILTSSVVCYWTVMHGNMESTCFLPDNFFFHHRKLSILKKFYQEEDSCHLVEQK